MCVPILSSYDNFNSAIYVIRFYINDGSLMSKKNNPKFKATPEEEDFGRKYTQEGSGKIGSKLLDNYFKAVEELFLEIEFTNDQPKVVEFGCGEGYSTQRLRNFLPGKINLEASEYVEAQISKARENNPDTVITQEDIYEVYRENGELDAAFLLEVLEHLDYPEQGLQEVARAIKKDGYLIIGVPREPIWCMANMARGKYLKSFGNTPGHLNHWTSKSMVAFVERHFGKVMAVRKPIPWTLILAKNHAPKR